MNRLYFGDNLKWLSDRKDYPRIQIFTVEGLPNGTERIDAPPQLNPFAMAVRESAREKQTEMLNHCGKTRTKSKSQCKTRTLAEC
jgi:hypothetical protein